MAASVPRPMEDTSVPVCLATGEPTVKVHSTTLVTTDVSKISKIMHLIMYLKSQK